MFLCMEESILWSQILNSVIQDYTAFKITVPAQTLLLYISLSIIYTPLIIH